MTGKAFKISAVRKEQMEAMMKEELQSFKRLTVNNGVCVLREGLQVSWFKLTDKEDVR